MPKIKHLPIHEAHKIAAGQVVERPANAIKELIENSIDAGASRITIYIKDGGKQFIRVVDNGHGMDYEDAQTCLEKHATSKIRSIDDLATITSYGFRGEALASIAAVGIITLLTKETGSTEGTKVTTHEGNITAETVACPEGTDITITDLFHNVPARAKFLKKRETETRNILQIVQAISLAYPKHHFQLFVDGNLSLNCPAQPTIINRFSQLWGTQTAQHMMPLETTEPKKGISLSGAISNHAWFRYDRRTIFFLVNNRWVTNHHLARALVKGYDNVIPHGRYPTACISITIDPEQIDINTHPKKEEIVFEHPRIVEQLIYKAVRTTLEKGVSQQIKREVSFVESTSSYAYPGLPARQATADRPVSAFAPPPDPQTYTPPPSMEQQIASPIPRQEQQAAIAAQTTAIPKEAEPYTLIGQFNKTYLLIEQEEGLYLIDQHAAHERILYELFAHRFEDVPTIQLMFPQLIPCNKDDLAILEPHLPLFHEHGIAIEPFGKDQLMIQSTPVHLKNAPLAELIKQVVGWIQEYSSVDKETFIKTVHDKLRAQMACKAAVKAGDKLSNEQMQELLSDLYECPNRFSCPHGRPTGWLFSLPEIEKKFRRR